MTNITAFANEEFIAKRKETVKEISADLLKVLHKDASSELQDKVENNFEALTGKPWTASDESVKPTIILDPPGTGRNAVFLEAAKSVAKGLGLNFEVNPPKEFAANSSDIVLLNIEVSDEQTPSFGSPISTTSEDAQQRENDHIKHINKSVSRNKDALATFIVFDEIDRGAPSFQDKVAAGIHLLMNQEASSEHLGGDSKFFVGFTGSMTSDAPAIYAKIPESLKSICKIKSNTQGLFASTSPAPTNLSEQLAQRRIHKEAVSEEPVVTVKNGASQP